MGAAGGQTLTPGKLSTRLALISAACVLAAVTAFAILASLQISRAEYRRLDLNLESKAQAISRDIQMAEKEGRNDRDNFWQYWGNEQPGQPIRRLNTGGRSQSRALPTPKRPGRGENVSISSRPFRMYTLLIPDAGTGIESSIRVATFSGIPQRAIREARTRLFIGAALAGALSVLAALLAARRGLRPLDTVQNAAEYVADSEDLQVRMAEQGPPEVRALAGSLNRMLERLSASQNRLQVALEEQRRFAQDASHELRTPLTAIRGHLDILERYQIPDEERDTILGEMGEAADRMKRLVEGLLALARTEGRAGPGETVELCETLREIATVEGEGPFIAEEDEMIVTGDREQIRGIFTNLVDNGRRYGGNITIHARREEDWAVVEVEDDGPGIPEDDRERVFDRFYRAPGLRSTPGSGLGLAIARQATTRIGGTLELIDGDKGARFEVRLPIAVPPEEPPEPPPGVAPVGDYEDDDE